MYRQYECIRITNNGRPTYGDKYVTIGTHTEYKHNDIINIEIENSKYLVLFEKGE